MTGRAITKQRERVVSLGRRPIPESRVFDLFVGLLTFGSLFPLLFVRLGETIAPLFWGYSICMTCYLLLVYTITGRYKPIPDTGFRPKVTVVVPVKNEAACISDVVQTVLASDYPRSLLEVIVVNDGSTDDSWERLQLFRDNPRVTLINHERNFGKRVALASGFSKAKSDIVICIDSDSFVDPQAIKLLVQPFADRKVVAVCGNGEAANLQTVLGRLQHYWYVEMFRLAKGMESKFGCVTCCSGILAAYRKIVVDAVLDEWLNERFAGRRITIGDDRQLTNLVARGLPRRVFLNSPGEDRTLTNFALSTKEAKVVFQSNAYVYTLVPESWMQFFKQQLRWKRAWVLGSIWGAKYMWKKRLPMAITFYVYQFVTYMSPVVIVLWLIVRPLQGDWIGSLGFIAGNLWIGLLHGLNSKKLSGISFKGILYRVVFVFVTLFITMTVLLYGWLTPWKGGWVTRTEGDLATPLRSVPEKPLVETPALQVQVAAARVSMMPASSRADGVDTHDSGRSP